MCLLQHCAGARLSRDDEISYLISWPSPLVRAPRTQPGRLAAVLCVPLVSKVSSLFISLFGLMGCPSHPERWGEEE
jgi:hypothetical protein